MLERKGRAAKLGPAHDSSDRPRASLPLLALLLVTGCSIDLQHGLTEEDANEIYVLLSKNGINATKAEGG